MDEDQKTVINPKRMENDFTKIVPKSKSVHEIQPEENHNSTPETLAIGSTIEGFEIRKVIGIGGFGIVYEAWDTVLERDVALKEYLPASLAFRNQSGAIVLKSERHRDTFESGMSSFINEARLLAQFDHPALVKVYRFWEAESTAYMVMPFYKGQTLKEKIHKDGPIQSQQDLLNILIPITEALGVLHTKQCIHRDISPENIIIQEETGKAILLDFGAARRTIGSLSQAFTVILKASYAPIEQYAEIPGQEQGPWTDIYALGALAHVMLKGSPPPSAISRMVNDSYKALAIHEQDTLAAFSPAVLQTIDNALTLQPEQRPQSMEELLRNLRSKPLPQPVTLPAPEKVEHQPHTSAIWFLVAAGLGISIAVAIGLYASRKPIASKSIPTIQTTKHATVPSKKQTDNSLTTTINESQKPSQETLETTKETPNKSQKYTPSYEPFADLIDRMPGGEEVTASPIQPTLKIGKDNLQFEVQSLLTGYVTVYVFSSDKQLIQLLPNKRVPKLTIKAGETLKLPPSKEPMQATGPAGTDELLVIVSATERNYSALKMSDYYGYGSISRIDALPENLIGTLKCNSALPCSDRYSAAWLEVKEVD